jgi:hypothetical protein
VGSVTSSQFNQLTSDVKGLEERVDNKVEELQVQMKNNTEAIEGKVAGIESKVESGIAALMTAIEKQKEAEKEATVQLPPPPPPNYTTNQTAPPAFQSQVPPGFPAIPKHEPRLCNQPATFPGYPGPPEQVTGYYYPFPSRTDEEGLMGCPQHLGEGKKSGSRAPSVSGTQGSDDRMSIKEVQPFLPVYTGGPNVIGFVKKFEKILEEGNMSDGRKYIALLG